MAASPILSEVEAPSLPSHDVLEGNVDHRGRPVNRSKSGRWKSACFIIGVEMAERAAYYGISCNLITYLTGPLGQSTATAAENVNAWSGTASLTPLAGAFIADSYLSRYRSIIIASIVYILALGSLTLSAILPAFQCHNASKNVACSPPKLQIVIFFGSLYLVAIAQGLHKPCAQAFGADQFDASHPKEAKSRSTFFNCWYLAMCTAITVTLLVLIYIQENLSWGLGFGIPCIAMVFALILFLLGTMTYRFHVKRDEGNPFLRIVQVFVKAARNWRVTLSEEERQLVLSNKFKFLDKALAGAKSCSEGGESCISRMVEDAKQLLRLIPILATCLVYGIVYSQSSTFFTKQGATMDRSITSRFQVPAASLQAVIPFSIVVFLAVYDRFMLPIARALTRKPTGITMLQRIGSGLFLSVLAMVVAALVEKKHLETAQSHGLVHLPKVTVPLSVMWLVPQYVLLGISESFAMVGLQEFFYDQVPADLKSTGLALYLSIFGVGGFLSSLLISVIEKTKGGHGRDSWFSNNLNVAHLDYFYWLIAGLSAAAFAAFLLVSKYYVYRLQSNSQGNS